MPSMIERIAEAEAEAARIKKQALTDGRAAIAQAAAEGARTADTAREQARRDIAQAEADAEKEGEALAKTIFAQKAAQADEACAQAAKNLDRAVEHILERAIGK